MKKEVVGHDENMCLKMRLYKTGNQDREEM